MVNYGARSLNLIRFYDIRGIMFEVVTSLVAPGYLNSGFYITYQDGKTDCRLRFPFLNFGGWKDFYFTRALQSVRHILFII